MRRHMSNPEALRTFYDHVWQQDDTGGQENLRRRRFQAACRDFAAQQMGDLNGLRVLEIGPGAGDQTVEMARQGATVYAADFSRVALMRLAARAQAEGLAERIVPLMMNGERLALADASVDRVTAETTLMHVDVEAIARESARTLRPGGRAVFVEPLAGNPLVALYRVFSHYRSTRPRYLTLPTFARMARHFAAYEHREFYLLSVGLSSLDPDGALGGLVRATQRLDAALIGAAPWLGRRAWMCVAAYRHG